VATALREKTLPCDQMKKITTTCTYLGEKKSKDAPANRVELSSHDIVGSSSIPAARAQRKMLDSQKKSHPLLIDLVEHLNLPLEAPSMLSSAYASKMGSLSAQYREIKLALWYHEFF